jgi:plasmid stability protein
LSAFLIVARARVRSPALSARSISQTDFLAAKMQNKGDSNASIAFFVDTAYNDVSILSHERSTMSTLTIRNVEPAVKEQLRVRAARNGRSMEAELRHILGEAVGDDRNRETNLAEAIRRRFQPFGGVDDLESHPPVTVAEPPAFDR